MTTTGKTYQINRHEGNIEPLDSDGYSMLLFEDLPADFIADIVNEFEAETGYKLRLVSDLDLDNLYTINENGYRPGSDDPDRVQEYLRRICLQFGVCYDGHVQSPYYEHPDF